MKGFTLPALAIMAGASAAHAAGPQTSSQPVPITGTVSNLCVLGAPTSTNIALGELINTSGAGIGKLAVMSDRSITLPGSFCNFANSTVSISATALTAADASTPPANFSRAVNYTATASNWAPSTTVATTAASTAGASPTVSVTGATLLSPKLADIVLVLSSFTAPSDNLLIAGSYSGSVTVTLAPLASP